MRDLFSEVKTILQKYDKNPPEIDVDIDDSKLSEVMHNHPKVKKLVKKFDLKIDKDAIPFDIDKAKSWVTDNIEGGKHYTKLEILTLIYPRYGMNGSNHNTNLKAEDKFNNLALYDLIVFDWEVTGRNVWRKK